MAYVPMWENLSDARQRVMVMTGCSEAEAESDICQALADRSVNIRAKLGRRTPGGATAHGTVLEGNGFNIPTNLKPEDLDWQGSRPLKPWMVPRGAFKLHGFWNLDWIELLRADVTQVLCSGGEAGGDIQRVSSDPATESKTLVGPVGTDTPIVSDSESNKASENPAVSERRRGPRPKTFERVKEAMMNDLRQGKLSAAELDYMLEKNLAADYGVSRDTARKARRAALSEFVPN